MSTPKPKRALAPLARAREALFRHIGQPPRQAQNLWLVYSSKTRRQWILTSDAAYLHFLAIEFDPEVKDFNLAPSATTVELAETENEVRFDAIVRRRDGRVECRRFASARRRDEEGAAVRDELEQRAAQLHNAYLVHVPVNEFATTTTRMQNAMRMLRFLQAALPHPLDSYRNSVLARLASERSMTLGALVQPYALAHQPLLLAAIFELVQQGLVQLDLDTAPITLASTLERVS